MTISDTELDRLETYLDGALAPDEVGALQARLVVEPELASALDELRAERSMRQAVWQAMEPDAMTADRLTWRLQGAMAAQKQIPPRAWHQWQIARIGSAAAACLVIGFFLGSAGRNGLSRAPMPQIDSSPVAINSPNLSAMPASSNAGLLVPVTNEYGQVVAWQPFGNPTDAKDFTEDLHRARAPVGVSPDVRLASDDKVDKVKF